LRHGGTREVTRGHSADPRRVTENNREEIRLIAQRDYDGAIYMQIRKCKIHKKNLTIGQLDLEVGLAVGLKCQPVKTTQQKRSLFRKSSRNCAFFKQE